MSTNDDAIERRKTELTECKKKAVSDVMIVLGCHEDRIDDFAEEITPDCSPRFEAIIYPVYIGIWLYQSHNEKRWIVEIDEVKNDYGWLEDGVERGQLVQHAAFATFKDALGAANSVIETLAELSYFETV